MPPRPHILATILQTILICLPASLSLIPAPGLVLKLALVLYYLLVPGLMLAAVLRLGFTEPIVWVQSVALSLVFLMATGFIANSLLPVFGVARPLDLQPTLICCGLALLPIAFFASRRFTLTRIWRHFADRPDPNWRTYILTITSFATFTLFVLGAIRLNNQATDILTIIAFGLLVATTTFCLLNLERLSVGSLCAFIYSVSLGLLLAYSLRSAHLMGFDITKEFYVFQLTQNAGRWLVANYPDPYNACLSITILPTLLAHLTHISGEYIYKFVYQVVFACVPVALFLTYSKLASRRIALVGTLLFVFQVYFMQQLPALVRQEIAFLFLALILNSLLIAAARARLLLYAFSLALIVSHYSTAYFWMFTLLIFYLGYFLIRKFADRFVKLPPRPTIVYPAVFVLGVILWFGQLTTTASSLGQFAARLPAQFGTLLSQDAISNDVGKLQFQNQDVSTQENLNSEYNRTSTEFGGTPVSTDPSYQPTLAYSSTIAPSVTGLLARIGPQVAIVVYILLTYGLEVLGMMVAALQRTRYSRLLLLDLLAVSCVPLVGIILLVPSISVDYNLSRAYTQLLLLFAPFAAVALFWLLDLISRLLRIRVEWPTMAATSLLLAIFLAYTSGLYYMVFGGPAYPTLANFGTDYDKFYTTTSEVAAIRWLGLTHAENAPVYSDEYGALQLQSRANIHKIRVVLYPNQVVKHSYVYLRGANVKQGLAFIVFGKQEIEYTVPIQTLSDSMNTVYVGPGVRILH